MLELYNIFIAEEWSKQLQTQESTHLEASLDTERETVSCSIITLCADV